MSHQGTEKRRHQRRRSAQQRGGDQGTGYKDVKVQDQVERVSACQSRAHTRLARREVSKKYNKQVSALRKSEKSQQVKSESLDGTVLILDSEHHLGLGRLLAHLLAEGEGVPGDILVQSPPTRRV
jgi:hypothetical protein